METYDFGAGPVSAHRHPNGGGWVADTAYVDDTAYVGCEATVADHAVVLGQVMVDRRAARPLHHPPSSRPPVWRDVRLDVPTPLGIPDRVLLQSVAWGPTARSFSPPARKRCCDLLHAAYPDMPKTEIARRAGMTREGVSLRLSRLAREAMARGVMQGQDPISLRLADRSGSRIPSP